MENTTEFESEEYYRYNTPELYYLTDSNISYIQPKDINNKILLPLMEHQKRALSYCSHLEENTEIDIPNKNYTLFTNKGLYCDQVGAGKSLVLLSLIANSPIVYPKTRIFSHTIGSIGTMLKNRVDELSAISVIVCPTTLFNQWKEYINIQTTLNFKFIYKSSDFDDTDFTNIDGILVTNSWYYSLCNCMKGIHISRVIFDEVHMLKLSKDKKITQEKTEKTPYIIDKISASFYWFISASPSDIRNNIYRRSGFFNTSLYEVLELGSGSCFKNTNNLISQKIILPDPITHIVSCKNTAILNVLSSVVNNSILESISADDVNGAIQKLGVEKLESDSIISLVNKDLLRKKDMFLSHIKELHTKIWKNENSKLKSIESYELKLKEIDQKIELIRKRILDSNIDPITCDDIITPAVTPCCQNTFEFKSLTSYLIKEKTSCPMCRSPLHPSQLLIIQNKSTINGKEEDIVDVLPPKNIVFSSKLEALTNILSNINKNTKNTKIIISSGQTANYTDVFNVISNFKMSM
jgi:hypothetical protein